MVSNGKRLLAVAAALAVIAIAIFTPAAVVKKTQNTLDDLVTVSPRLWVNQNVVPVESVRAESALAGPIATRIEGWDRFLTENGTDWTLLIDKRTGLPAIVEGQGIPWITGLGNSLSADDAKSSFAASRGISTRYMEGLAREFISRNENLLPVDNGDLVLIPEGSGEFGGYLWYIQFQQVYQGVPVEGARVIFRVNNGNLVQFGAEKVAAVSIDPIPSFDRETAREILAGFIGGFGGDEEWMNEGSVSILPVTPQGDIGAYEGPIGQGLEHKLAYTMVFHRPGVMGTWKAQIDAHSGEILSFRDDNSYGAASGGIYPVSPLDTEVVRPFPSLTVTNGTTKYTDIGGNYTFATGSASAALTGKYVKVVDTCGTSSLTNSTSPGDLAFSKSTGTDCTTPGVGGAGNTHAARSGYYHLTNWKLKAQTWLPSNTWLQAQLTDNVNLNQTCNAYWNGSSVNMFKSGGGCRNSGELPTVVLHEVGHGLDSNDGNSSADNGTGESYGDTMGFLLTHDSCMGTGFFSDGSKCSGYGDACTTCTGIRDVDYAKHTSATAHTPLNFVKAKCPTSSSYKGPCSREGHCEGYIAAEAAWDLAVRDLPAAGYDTNTSWFILERLFYLSRATAGSAYTCNSSTFASDGCGTSSWFYTFRVVDDSDGNLSNGTPHAAAIYAAFNRHAIGCSTAVNTNNTTCAALTQPTLTATAGSGQVSLSWGAITNATRYWIFRNEISATAGMMKIAEVTATSYTDTLVSAGVTYYYTVMPLTASNSCFGAMASVKNATPTGGTTTTYSISGTVTLNSAGLSGVTISAGSTTATTDTSGNYTLTGLANGTYTVTPSKSGYTFSPTSTSVTISSANVTGKNFTATATATYAISGTITLNSAAFSGVTVACTGQTSVTTDSSGNYSFSGLANGTYTVTPSKSGYTFSPANYSVTISSANATGKNFTATATSSDTQLTSGTAVSGSVGYQVYTYYYIAVPSGATNLQVDLTGLSADVDLYTGNPTLGKPTTASYTGRSWNSGTTAETLSAASPATGNWWIGVYGYAAGSYTVKATVTTGTTTYSISGAISGAVLSGVTVTAGTKSGVSTSTGAYTISGLANGTYTVTPSLSGYTFSPTSTSVTISGANVTGKNFTATASGGGDTALTSGVGVAGSVTQGSYKYYYITVPSGATQLTVTLTGLSADVDLYTKSGAKPTTSSYTGKSENGGTTSETVTHSSPTAGTWYFGAYGYAAGSYTITATVTSGGGGTTTQVLVNPGFESGTSSWTVSTSTAHTVMTTVTTPQAAHGGSYQAQLGYYNGTYYQSETDSIRQTVTIPSTATAATLSFWYNIRTQETTTSTAYDKLTVTVENSSGTVLATLTTLSNLNKTTAWTQKTGLSLLSYKGQTVVVRFKATTDSSLGTFFGLDDLALNVTQ